MGKKKDDTDKFQITEMFLGRADKDRCFFGCIKRGRDENDKPFVFSRLVMPHGLLCAREAEQKVLGDNLDKMCIMICDKGLHSFAGVSTEIFGAIFFLN